MYLSYSVHALLISRLGLTPEHLDNFALAMDPTLRSQWVGTEHCANILWYTPCAIDFSWDFWYNTLSCPFTFKGAKHLTVLMSAVEWYKSRAHISFLSQVILNSTWTKCTCSFFNNYHWQTVKIILHHWREQKRHNMPWKHSYTHVVQNRNLITVWNLSHVVESLGTIIVQL